jgi:NAD-dependent SIR2 family protein deacetylase
MHYALRDQPVDVPAATPAQLLDWARQHCWLVITGAGCSTAGIPDYRDQAG